MDRILDKFDFGIENGEVINDSNYIWCTSERGLQIRNFNHKIETVSSQNVHSKSTQRSLSPSSAISSYHQFGILLSDHFGIICAKDFKYMSQCYLLISLFNKNSNQNMLAVYHVSSSKVVCAIKIDHQVTKLDIVNTKSLISTSLIKSFSVCAFCGCTGGAIYAIDVTPRPDLLSNEYSPLSLSLYSMLENEDINAADLAEMKLDAIKSKKIFGVHLNEKYCNMGNFFYTMPNDEIMAKIEMNTVKVTTLKYEKQIDSLLVGYNFGSFQIWNMKSFSIESSSAYAHLSRPVLGFSLLEPQNDPKKCMYLLVAHSTMINNGFKVNQFNSAFEVDEEDDNENDSSFILLYQLNYEKKYLFKNYQVEESDEINYDYDFFVYENLNNCIIVFEHDLTSNTLQYTNLNENNYENDEIFNQGSDEKEEDVGENDESSMSKILSIQTIKVHSNGLDVDLACLCWTLVNKKSSISNNFYYLTLFNINNWYMQCMPSKLDRNKKSFFLNNFLLNIDIDYTNIKSVNIVESNIKKLKTCHDDSILSIYFEILVLSSFMLVKYTIKPIEEQIKHFINKQDDLFQYQDKIYNLLYRYNLLPVKTSVYQDKFLSILNYLIENSELYAITKTLKRLESIDTSILSNFSLKTVLDWTWIKFIDVKSELTFISKKLIEQMLVFDIKLKQTLMNNLKLIKNLIHIYELFIQLNKSNEGFIELSKKLSILQSFELYCEHLNLCLEYNLLPEKINPINQTSKCKLFSFDVLHELWLEKRKSVSINTTNKYNFGFMIDCLINDCKSFAYNSKLLKYGTYPAKSVHEILEVFLECNLTSDLRQLIFLYFIIDIQHNIRNEYAQKIDNLIKIYCKNDTIKNNLFNMAMALYFMDIQDADASYSYFRNCDVNYLELNEKYRILYNLAYLNKWTKSLEFLWLFNNILDDFNLKEDGASNSELYEINAKLMISIYLSNKLINEAYEIIKNHSNDKCLYKQLIVYFLIQSETFNLWKPVMEFFTSNQFTLQLLYSYLEAKQDLNSICTAIDLYLTHHDYTEAIQLYEKYSRQINHSQYSYISTMIEAVKETNNSKLNKQKPKKDANSMQIITPNDIKEAKVNFTARSIPSKLSKRCKMVLNETVDSENVKVLSLFDIDSARPMSISKIIAPNTSIVATSSSATPCNVVSSSLTPQKPNSSILKSTNSNISIAAGLNTNPLQQLTPSKSVKFKLLKFMSENEGEEDLNEKQMRKQDQENTLQERCEIVNLKEKELELRKSSSVASFDSAMSVISSRSASNLQARLDDLENDENLMNRGQERESNDVEMNLQSDTLVNCDDIQKSANSSSSFDSTLSTLSSKSGRDLEKRLTEVQTPMSEDAQETQQISEDNSIVSDDTSLFKVPTILPEASKTQELKKNLSISSTLSTMSSNSNLSDRLDEVQTGSTADFNLMIQKINNNQTSPFKKPVNISSAAETLNEQTMKKTISVASTLSTLSSKSGSNWPERLKDFDEKTIEETFKIDDKPSNIAENVARLDENQEMRKCLSIDSINSIRSTMSSQSGKNLQKRLKDFDNESMDEDKPDSRAKYDAAQITNDETDEQVDTEQNVTLRDSENVIEQVADILESPSSSHSEEKKESVNEERISPSITTVTPITITISSGTVNNNNLNISQATTITIDSRQFEDEIIFSISDNDDEERDNDRDTSFTSISSKCTTNTDFSSVSTSRAKPAVKKTPGRKPKASAKFETTTLDESSAADTTLKHGPVTRSKLKSLGNNNKSSLEDSVSSQEPVKPRAKRATRSMTRSPSPTNSTVSTASTTVARNSIKRRGSNRIKKPTIIISPTNILEQQKQKIDEIPANDEANTSASRYNLRSRMKTPQKDTILEDLVETAANLTPKVAKKSRGTKKHPLYKIDETDNPQKLLKDDNNQQHPHNLQNEFEFSCPHHISNSQTSYISDNTDVIQIDDESEHDSSFTFSPPQSNINK